MDQISKPVFSTLRRRSLREEVDTVTKKAPRVDPGEIVIVKYDPKVVSWLREYRNPRERCKHVFFLISLGCPQTAVTEDGRSS